MSTKFEQLLDYLVNEEHEKANELFHEIVVEKSRTIYENLISEEEDEMDEAAESDDEEMDEAAESDDEEMDEAKEEDMDESSEELEDSYMMDAEEEPEADKHDFAAGDATDDLGADVMGGDEEGHEGEEDHAMMDIKNAIQELEAAFAELEKAQDSEEHDMGIEHDHEFDDEEEQEDEMMSMQEARRMTREYVEKVGHDWDKSNTQKGQGADAGAGTGEKVSKPLEDNGPVSSGKGKPTTGANAKSIAQSDVEGQSNVGTKPLKVHHGITAEKGDKFAKDMHNVGDAHSGFKASGVKTLKKETGWPKNNQGEGHGVGAKTGGKEAGQTGGSTNTRSTESGQRK